MSKKNKIKVSPPDMGAMPPPSFMSTTFASMSDKKESDGSSREKIAKRRYAVSQKQKAQKK